MQPRSPSKNWNQRLVDRMAYGQKLLIKTRQELSEMPNAGIQTKKEERYIEAFKLWLSQEYMWRYLGGEGCAVGVRCTDDAVIVCEACAPLRGVPNGMAPKRHSYI